MSREEVNAGDGLEISLRVKNVGELAGDEVVQLYVRDIYASVVRSVKELAGFRRLHLEPGEERQVVFTLHTSQLAFPDEKMRWKIEHGEICLEVGASSEDIRLRGSFRITGDRWIEGKNRAFYAGTEVRRDG